MMYKLTDIPRRGGPATFAWTRYLVPFYVIEFRLSNTNNDIRKRKLIHRLPNRLITRK